MSRDKQTEIQQFAIDLQNASQRASKIIVDETANYVKQNHKYNNLIDYAKAHIKSRFEYEAEFLVELGYAKASDVAREIFEDIFYHTYYSHGRLIIEHSTLLALQKKYTEEGK